MFLVAPSKLEEPLDLNLSLDSLGEVYGIWGERLTLEPISPEEMLALNGTAEPNAQELLAFGTAYMNGFIPGTDHEDIQFSLASGGEVVRLTFALSEESVKDIQEWHGDSFLELIGGTESNDNNSQDLPESNQPVHDSVNSWSDPFPFAYLASFGDAFPVAPEIETPVDEQADTSSTTAPVEQEAELEIVPEQELSNTTWVPPRTAIPKLEKPEIARDIWETHFAHLFERPQDTSQEIVDNTKVDLQHLPQSVEPPLPYVNGRWVDEEIAAAAREGADREEEPNYGLEMDALGIGEIGALTLGAASLTSALPIVLDFFY